MIRWQPGFVYKPVFYPPHYPLDAVAALIFVAITVGVAFVAIRRPANGVAALIACTPFSYAHYLGGTSLTVLKAALVGLIIALIGRRSSLSTLREPRILRFLVALALVLGAIVLSGFGAEYKDAVAREFAKWLEYVAIFGAVAIGFADDPDDRPIWFALVLTTAVVAILALAQEFIGAPAGVFVHGKGIPRIAGPLEGPNQLSAWLDIAVPILLARILIHRDGLVVAVATMAVVADALTLSRSGLVALGAGCLVVLLATRPPRLVRVRFAAGAIAVAAILIILGASIGLEARFFSLAEIPQPDHLGTRAQLWKAALDLWRSSPIVGIGAGNYEFALARVGLPDVRTHANSIYLQSLAETGLLGLAATLYLSYLSIQTFAPRASRRPLVIGALAASAAFALHQIFDYLVFFPKVGSLWWIVLALGTVELINAREDTSAYEVAA